MAISRKALTIGAVSVAGLALVGTGAGATFSDSVHETQSLEAGTMNMQIDGPGHDVSADGKTITLPTFGPTGSTFESTKQVVTITNSGNIPARAASIQMSESHAGNANDNALFAQTNVCIMSTDPSGTWTEGNGPLATAVALTPSVNQNSVVIQPGESIEVWVTYYAGQDSANCGEVSSDGSNTTAAWNGYQGHPYQTPASLTNAAQGGTITPTMTFSFTG
jgi:hypothetical protein